MENDNIPTGSKGWLPPLLIEFTFIAVLMAHVSDKWPLVKETLISSPEIIFYTTIGLIELLFDNQ